MTPSILTCCFGSSGSKASSSNSNSKSSKSEALTASKSATKADATKLDQLGETQFNNRSLQPTNTEDTTRATTRASKVSTLANEVQPPDRDSTQPGPAVLQPVDTQSPQADEASTQATRSTEPGPSEGNHSIKTSPMESTTGSITGTFGPERPQSPIGMSPRVYSWPERPEPFRVIVYTQFKDNTKSIELDIPSNSTVEDSYKLIASTAKEYTLDFCKGSLDGKELTLALGHCKVSCRSVDQSAPDPDKRAPAPYEMKLENWKDWSAITSIIVNWESMGYQDISVVITRIIEVTTPKKIIDNDPPLWLYEELINVPQKLPNTGVTFIPKAEIERLTSIDVIRNVINHENDSHEDDRESLIEYIHQDGKVLFLLVVKMDLSLRVLQEAKNEEFNDKCLPVKTSDGLEAPWIKDKKTRLRWKTNLDKWQWDFHAASFTRSSRNSKFDSRIVVPYTSKEVRGKGAFSIVYAVSLEESHQKIYELPAIGKLPADRNPPLALKSILERRNHEAASEHERFLLEGMLHTNHLHIIELLATYQQDGQWHFLFPLAECSLEEYMQKGEPKRTRKYMVWILHQIAGLAKGLQEIHDNSKNFKPEKAPSLEPGMNLQSKVGNWLIGYHHDIKPQNILHFKRLNKDITTPSPEYGVYQIADFGVGKFYQHMSDYSPGTIHHRGTITYAAPESRISYSDSGNVRSKGNLHLSRPYDVWSFGCVVMETLVWLILGKREWIQFNEKRFGNVIEDNNAEISDAFWVASDGLKKAYVKPVVKKMLSDLRDSERVKKSESFAGMVDLVENILDVNPRTRIAIPNVVGRLEAILRGTGHDNGLDDYPESLSSTGRSTPTVSITEPNDEIPITHVDMQNLLPPARTLPNPKRSSLKRLMARATPSGHSDGRPPIV